MAEIRYGGNTMFPYREQPVDLRAVTATIDPDHPWLATVVERLDTDAPATANPYCCYLRTVIFYERPWRYLKDKHEYASYGRCETVLIEDWLYLDGEVFELCGGKVSHDGDGWIMTRRARRKATQLTTERKE